MTGVQTCALPILLALWDYAAGLVILEEAGGKAYTMSGDALPLDGRKSNIVAGSPRCIEESGLLKYFN